MTTIDKQLRKYFDNEKVVGDFFWNDIRWNIDIYDTDTHYIGMKDYEANFIDDFVSNYHSEYDADYTDEDLLYYADQNFDEWSVENDMDMIFNHYLKQKAEDLFREEYAEDCEYIWNKMIKKAIKDDLKEDLDKIAFDIAIKKILRSKIYNYGLGLKLNMRDAGITAVN